MDMSGFALVALGGILLLVAWWNYRATKKRTMQRRREAMLRCIERLRREQW